MPNYSYKCMDCGFAKTITLPISFSPKKLLDCAGCLGSSMERKIIMGSYFNMSDGHTLGQWYKNKTGKELLGDK